MSNKTIPLRRARRRRETKLKTQRALNALNNMLQACDKYLAQPVPAHFPSGGISLRSDIPSEQEFETILGWTPEDGKRYRQLIEEAIDEYKVEPGLLIPNTIQIHDAKWGPLRTEWAWTPVHPLDIDRHKASEESCEDLPPMAQPCDNTPYQPLHTKGFKWHETLSPPFRETEIKLPDTEHLTNLVLTPAQENDWKKLSEDNLATYRIIWKGLDEERFKNEYLNIPPQ